METRAVASGMIPPFGAWAGPKAPRILFIGEAWGREEAASGSCFVGAAGKEFWRMLGEAFPDLAPEEHHRVEALHNFGSAWVRERESWLEEAGLAFTNVLNFRPPDNKLQNICLKRKDLPASYNLPALLPQGLYLPPEYLGELARLEEEIVASRPNLLVALGNTACWALLRTTGIGSIRGTTLSDSRGRKVLPTFHPATVLYQWQFRPIVVADLMKASHEGGFAEIRRPRREILIDPSIEEWEARCEALLRKPPPLLGCDTETSLRMIDTLGFASSRGEAFVCQFRPHRTRRGSGFVTIWPQRDGREVANYWTPEEELRFWRASKTLLEDPAQTLCFQNGAYDAQYLLRMGIRPRLVEDPMILHHALYPELRKGLGFLGSIYTSEASWKLMHREADSTKRDE